MDPFTAIGLASNVLSFIDTGAKLCALIGEYSSAPGAPQEIIDVSKRLELIITMIQDLDESGKARLNHEKLALEICCNEAEELHSLVEGLRIDEAEEEDRGRLMKRFSSSKKAGEKVWKAFKMLHGRERIDKLQTSLERILSVIQLQQQIRMEAITLKVDQKADILVENSRSILTSLSDLRLASNPSIEASLTHTKSVFMVPLASNSGFLGREDIMAKLDAKIGSHESPQSKQVNTTQSVALFGLGGIGKSQIALQHAFKQNEHYPEISIFWIHGSTSTRFEQDYKKIASEFQLPGRDDPQVDVLQIVQDWFRTQYQRPWLMIVDNVDDDHVFKPLSNGKSLFDYLPKSALAKGSILYTSRSRDISLDLAEDPINVPPLSPEEGLRLLQTSDETATIESKNALLQELDYLPLAIMQAVSFMIKRKKTILQYLELFHHSEELRLTLLKHKFISQGRQTATFDSVAATWIVSFQQIRSEDLEASNLLCLMSLLDRDSIPFSLLSNRYKEYVAFDLAVGLLESYSFITVGIEGNNCSMHRLVQSATRAWLTDQGALCNNLLSEAIQIMSVEFPDCEFENWPTCALYLPHAESALSWHGKMGISSTDKIARADLLSKIARYYKAQGFYTLAKERAEESLWTAGIIDTLQSLQVQCLLAAILEQQGQLREAIQRYHKILKKQANLLGTNHLDTLNTADHLAMALANTFSPENWTTAEQLANQALAGRKLLLPENHPQILASIRTVGWILYKQSRYEESETVLRNCLIQREVVLGESHPLTAETTTELALVLLELNPPKFEEAEAFLRRSAKTGVSIHGTDHPSTIITLCNLSGLLRRAGKYEEAEELQRSQLEVSKKILDRNQPTMLWCLTSLGTVLFQQAKFPEALEFLQEELSNRQNLIDQDLLAVLDLLDLRGRTYEKLRRLEEAEKDLQRAAEGRSRQLGPSDARTLQTWHNLARVLRAQGRFQDAGALLLDTLNEEEKILGKTHEQTLASHTLLGLIYYSVGRHVDAEVLFRYVVAAKEDTLGSTHESTIGARDLLEAALGR
ncbi:hypothetical protein BGZ60DRAFT_565234 [Tricladium varicosporioides]|nr:hypothetical protein BGZ60DRAFT_565234 [Hymenoscyphus varicosporioides]